MDNLRLTLTGTASDLYGLAAFLEDPKYFDYFGFEKMDAGYTLFSIVRTRRQLPTCRQIYLS